MKRRDNEWIDHRYFRTYSVAARLTAAVSDPYTHLPGVESLTADGDILAFIAPWQSDTLVHKLARWVADDMFLEDTDGPYISKHDLGLGKNRRYLPVDLCLVAYGLSSAPGFEVPPPDGYYENVSTTMKVWRESTNVANACYDYFLNDIRVSQPYEVLLEAIGDEVFHVVFRNRELMFRLNQFLAELVQEIEPEMLTDTPELRKQFTARGDRLRRSKPPARAQRAVFFRDAGLCVICGVDLTGRFNILTAKNFDHIVPLAAGGLNDVTNLQLLCQGCNATKSDSPTGTSRTYPRFVAHPNPKPNAPWK
ncbi:HNH endonuclease [Phytoactinopolyspora limicola]|uniref:HNH endonuclease n=1 Tax=Phytoactinopolyspora limicola TaxID=2715536 RepID=UPI00140DFA97|nr:HNH endonuclease signature motif containing protein [Phytoactinopolyspora limicola]